MKKLLLIVAVSTVFASCISPSNNSQWRAAQNDSAKVIVYKQHDRTLNDFIYWYLLLRPDGSYYYHRSVSPIYSFRNIIWTTDNTGFNKGQAQEQPYQYVPTDDFSPELVKEFHKSDNFEYGEKSGYKYNESNDFSTDWGSSSSDNNSYDYGESDDFGSSGSDYDYGESNDFSGGDDGGSSYDYGESNDFE